MTISILGCGWYGLALAKTLISKGITVKGSTTSAEKLPILTGAGIEAHLLDLSTQITNAVFFDCDVLIIAIPPKARSEEGASYVPKLQIAIDDINAYGVKKVILISSTGVYSDPNAEVNELTHPQPDAVSGKVLWEAEDLFRQQTNFKTTIIRFGGLIGPGREPGRFFAGKKDIPNGLAPVNMIHLNDCIGVTEAIINQDVFGCTINACTPHHPQKSLFYARAAAKAGLSAPEFIPELNEWKIVSSVNIPQILNYQYRIQNWNDWLA